MTNEEHKEKLRKEMRNNALKAIRKFMNDDSITMQDLSKLSRIVQYSTKDYVYDSNV